MNTLSSWAHWCECLIEKLFSIHVWKWFCPHPDWLPRGDKCVTHNLFHKVSCVSAYGSFKINVHRPRNVLKRDHSCTPKKNWGGQIWPPQPPWGGQKWPTQLVWGLDSLHPQLSAHRGSNNVLKNSRTCFRQKPHVKTQPRLDSTSAASSLHASKPWVLSQRHGYQSTFSPPPAPSGGWWYFDFRPRPNRIVLEKSRFLKTREFFCACFFRALCAWKVFSTHPKC